MCVCTHTHTHTRTHKHKHKHKDIPTQTHAYTHTHYTHTYTHIIQTHTHRHRHTHTHTSFNLQWLCLSGILPDERKHAALFSYGGGWGGGGWIFGLRRDCESFPISFLQLHKSPSLFRSAAWKQNMEIVLWSSLLCNELLFGG